MKVHLAGPVRVVQGYNHWGVLCWQYEARMLCGAETPALFENFRADSRSFRRVRHYRRCRRCDRIQRGSK